MFFAITPFVPIIYSQLGGKVYGRADNLGLSSMLSIILQRNRVGIRVLCHVFCLWHQPRQNGRTLKSLARYFS